MTTTMSTKIGAALVAASLVVASLAASWAMPAAATELPVPPLQKAASADAPAKKVVRQHSVIRLASAAWLPALEGGSRWAFPVILGVAY
jgi:hypothetical protein